MNAESPESKESAKASPAFRADGSTAGKVCSICQTAIIAGEDILTCGHCALPFHVDCWKENQGCSAYGCESAPKTIKPSAPAAAVSDAWGSEKPCPSCGKSIKAEALKCRFCGASFQTRNVISRGDYARREYEGKEYANVRNKAIVLFLLSVAGCLAPLGVLMCAILIYNKTLMGIDYNRLPPTLKAVVWSGICVGGFLIFFCGLLIAFDG